MTKQQEIFLAMVNVPVDCLMPIHSKDHQFRYFVEVNARYIMTFENGEISARITYNNLDATDLRHIDWDKFTDIVEILVSTYFKESVHASTGSIEQ